MSDWQQGLPSTPCRPMATSGSHAGLFRTLAPMNIARGLEQRLENLVDGVSASVFRGHMHPVTMASRLVRQLDFLSFETPAGPQIPNDLTVAMHPADLDPTIDVAALEVELATVGTVAADDAGWRLVGPVEVHLATSQAVPRGILQCAGDSMPGRLPTWGQLIAVDGSAVVPLTINRTLIGRALDCDVRFANYQVSRHHAILTRVRGDVRIADLGSSNGTRVNGDRISERPVDVPPGSLVTFGDLSFTYRSVA